MRPELQEFTDRVAKLSDKNLSKLLPTEIEPIRLEIVDYVNKVVEVCANDEVEIKTILLSEQFTQFKHNIIHVVAKFGDDLQLDELLKFINDPAYVNIKDNSSFTALHYAASNGWPEAVKVLLANGADANPQASDEKRRWTPIHFAAKNGHLEIVKILLNAGVDKEVKTAFGLTILHIAAENGRTDIVRFLLENGINKEAKTILENYEMTPLHYAAIGGHHDALLALLESGVEIDAKTADGRTALHIAAKSSQLVIVAILLKWGAGFWDQAYEIAKLDRHEEVALEIRRYLEMRKNIFKNLEFFSPELIKDIQQYNEVNLSEEKVILQNDDMVVFFNAYGLLSLKCDAGIFFKVKKTLIEFAEKKHLFDLSQLLRNLAQVTKSRK